MLGIPPPKECLKDLKFQTRQSYIIVDSRVYFENYNEQNEIFLSIMEVPSLILSIYFYIELFINF